MVEHYIAWWNVENLFEEYGSPNRIEKIRRTVEEDLQDQLARLRRVGIDEVVAVDLTKPEFGIPVVRVVIPGLEGIDDSPEYLLGDRGRAVLEGHAEGHA